MNAVNILFKETGSLGVRTYSCRRFILHRQTHTLALEFSGKIFKVKVKVAELPDGKLVNIKPEFEDVRRIASETGLSIKETSDIIVKRFYESSKEEE